MEICGAAAFLYYEIAIKIEVVLAVIKPYT
jgi:hypothetical protein